MVMSIISKKFMSKNIISSVLFLALVFGAGVGVSVSAQTYQSSYSNEIDAAQTQTNVKVQAKSVTPAAVTGRKGVDGEVPTIKFNTAEEFEAARKYELERCRRTFKAAAEVDACLKKVEAQFIINRAVKPTVVNIKENQGEDRDASKEDRAPRTIGSDAKMENKEIRKDRSEDRDEKMEKREEHFRRLIARFNAYHERLSKLADLLGERIGKLASQNTEAAVSAKSHLALAFGYLRDARLSIDTAVKLWQNTNAADSAAASKGDIAIQYMGEGDEDGVKKPSVSKDVYTSIKEALEDAKKSLREARKELSETLKAIRQDLITNTKARPQTNSSNSDEGTVQATE